MNNILKSYHGNPKLKSKYVKLMKAHQDADTLVKGKYWENGKGCAVGCMFEGSYHNKYPTELGLPEWLAYLEDTIFEGLPNGESKKFPVKFLKSIKVGSDLSLVKPKFLLFTLENLPNDYKKFPKCKEAIENIIKILKRESKGNLVSEKERSAAWSAAESAAESAAWSATRSAAESAAWSATRSAAESAAWSATRSAAESATRSAAYKKMANELIKLLKECK